MQNQNKIKIFAIGVIITAFNAILQLDPNDLAYSQAVDLIPINTGNVTLDSSLPVFYECIEEAVDASENAPQQAPYFEDEPTKNEVRGCYQEVLAEIQAEEENKEQE